MEGVQALLTLLNNNQVPARIDVVELFRLDPITPGTLNFDTGDNRQHAALRLCANGMCGWSEGIISQNDPSFQLAPWGACFSELKGKTVAEALQHQRQHREIWWVNQLEMAELALLDLAGRLLQKSALSLLVLDGRQPVPGLFCVTESDPRRAAEQARFARQNNLTTHIKLKIFGEPSLDVTLIRAVRQVMGTKTYIVADADEGYGRLSETTLDELAVRFTALRQAGLNALQDPAVLANTEWVALQNKVGLLDLVPDKVLHPAWNALRTFLPGMGKVYHLRPGSMGSLIDAVALAKRMRESGARISIGDNSLVGPGCTSWQQIAIGLGAVWVEALEKPDESDVFLQCIKTKSTEQKTDGRYGLIFDFATRDLRPGFGLEVDVPRLRRLCSAYCSI